MSQPSTTNCPKLCMRCEHIVKKSLVGIFIVFFIFCVLFIVVEQYYTYEKVRYVRNIYGGYSVGVPPLPIPNREVKPVHADGTAFWWESR